MVVEPGRGWPRLLHRAAGKQSLYLRLPVCRGWTRHLGPLQRTDKWLHLQQPLEHLWQRADSDRTVSLHSADQYPWQFDDPVRRSFPRHFDVGGRDHTDSALRLQCDWISGSYRAVAEWMVVEPGGEWTWIRHRNPGWRHLYRRIH